MDGDCTGGNPKVIELYANGTVNFADFAIENQTNANTEWGQTLNLAALGTVTNDFVYIIHGDAASANLATFNTEFPGIPAANVLSYPTGTGTPQPLNINGDDRVRLINATTLVVLDQFGESGVDGTGTNWEYIDSWAKRTNGTLASGGFVSADWTYGGVASLDGLGTCQGAAAFSTVVPFGQFTLGVKQNSIEGLKVYPNPVTNGTLYINTTANASKEVVIYDVLGKQVVKTTTENAVNVSKLNAGVYIVKVTEEGKTATRKLVIK
ncbi:MAG: T9SS type A sorting domain-containing protein [Flavobacterium sp.]|nr:MAG: T9SS type A sorting domain-containing protein [Flavobacterium sp.]